MEFLKHSIDLTILLVLGSMGFLALLFTLERIIFLSRTQRNLQHYHSVERLEQVCTTNLTTLYIIYSNAPYVGLLGTVVGIMITFYDMGKASAIDASAIMTGLSLALYATALGLVVAIPTLIAYNALNRKIAVILTNFKHQEPSALKPSASKPSVSEPSLSEPSVSEPSVSEPSALEPKALKSYALEPSV